MNVGAGARTDRYNYLETRASSCAFQPGVGDLTRPVLDSGAACGAGFDGNVKGRLTEKYHYLGLNWYFLIDSIIDRL